MVERTGKRWKGYQGPAYFTYNGVLLTDIKANFDRCPTIGTTSWRIQEEIGELKTYEENVTYLFDWLHHRIEWIDKELSSL